MEQCELCERPVSHVSRHHLTPLQKGGKYSPTVKLCQPCHATIHLHFTNTELAQQYNSIEKLKASGRLDKYLAWIAGKDIERIPVRRKQR